MITNHPSFPPPTDQGVSIWRYMNLSKFVWTLQKKALYFCRSDLLGDPYEGYYPKTLADGEDEFVRNMLITMKDSKPETEVALRQGYKTILATTKNSRQELFLSCWHMNEVESLAMWKLYTSHNESICVRSRFTTLATLLDKECFLGCVRYIDYTKDYIDMGNMLNYIMHKRNSFAHEREARAVIWQNVNSPKKFKDIDNKALLVPIDTSKLIEEIFVSPESNKVLRDVVEQLARDHGVNAPVRQSEANLPPGY